MNTITTIKDTRIRVKVSKDLSKLLEDNKKHLNAIPENISKLLNDLGINLPSKVEVVNNADTNKSITSSNINVKLLRKILKENDSKISKAEEDSKPKAKKENSSANQNEKNSNLDVCLCLSDLKWLSNFLSVLRKEQGSDLYLNDVLETCSLQLPENEVIQRNPELEARCQRLREEQQNLEYRKMTKNVDATLQHYPEDTVAYQMKAINSQIIAVLQFVVSVAAGFAFGFIGIQLIIGNLDFGLRLLLGIMFALIIALAEIYFLAKKLNEYDNTVDTANKILKKNSPIHIKKVHND